MRKILLVLPAVAITSIAAAGTIDITATDRGWYNNSGNHTPTNDNYIVGRSSGGTEWHNWFVFDLTAVAGQIASITFYAWLPAGPPPTGYTSPDATETYEIFDYTGDINSLMNGTAGVAAFNDLAGGTSYGPNVISDSDEGTFVAMPLNAAGVADANAAGAGLWAFGGAVTTLGHPGQQESIWGNTHNTPMSNTYITVTLIPAPAGAALFAVVGLLGARRRRD